MNNILTQLKNNPKYIAWAAICLLAIHSVFIVLFVLPAYFAASELAKKVHSNFADELITEKESIEGAVTFFLTFLFSGMAYYAIISHAFSFFGLLLATIFSTWADSYYKGLYEEDNLSAPIIAGILMSLI